jgi:Domain of unknown function (DUF3943)
MRFRRLIVVVAAGLVLDVLPFTAAGAPSRSDSPASDTAPARATLDPDPDPAANTSTSGNEQSTEGAAQGYYLDPLRGETPFLAEYERWFSENRRKARYGRTALELGGVLAIGTSYYWIVSDPNKQDWDYIDIKDRSLHVEVKFDNNMFRTNFLLHPLAGTMSYWLARSNGLDIYGAFACSALSSASFEFLLEWLEKPSINDLITTPMGGLAAGEFFFHLGDYLNSAVGRANVGQRVLAYTIGAPQALNDALEGSNVPRGPADALGYSAAYWHDFKIGYGLADVTNDRGDRDTVHDLLFNVKLAAMPGFLRPGKFSVDFSQGNFTEARLRTSVADGLLKDVDLFIASDLVGHYQQDYTGSPKALVGSGSMLAASADMRYVDRWLLNRRDQFSMFHFLGPSGRAWYGPGGGLLAKVEGRLHLDFGGITSHAYPALVAVYGSEGTKSVLQLQKYYLGLGGSARLHAAIEWSGAELGGYAAYGTYRSVDGLDRYVTPLDVANTDQIIELGAALSYSPPAAPLYFRLGVETLQHRSQMGPFSVAIRDSRFSASGAVVF